MKDYVTDQAIDKIPRLKYKGVSSNDYDNIYELSKNLLKISKDENNSNEVAIVYGLSRVNELGDFMVEDYVSVVLGDEHSVNVMQDAKASLLLQGYKKCMVMVMHNHPSLFSMEDIQFFIKYTNVVCMSVINNLGHVSYLTKSNFFSLENVVPLYNEAVTMHNNAKTFKEQEEATKYFLANCKKHEMFYQS